MPAKKKEVDPRDASKWETVRARATAAEAKARAKGPNPERDLAGAIAYRAGFVEPRPFDDELRRWINSAKEDHRFTWREIGAILGVDDRQAQYLQASRNRRARPTAS